MHGDILLLFSCCRLPEACVFDLFYLFIMLFSSSPCGLSGNLQTLFFVDSRALVMVFPVIYGHSSFIIPELLL